MPVDRVIDAALELIDDVGVVEFTMRLLAQRLNSSTATLYRHFAGKDEIFVLVVDQVLGEVPRHIRETATGTTWKELLLAGADAFFQTLKEHPNTVPLFAHQVPLGPNGLAGREAAIDILLSNGFTPEVAARTYTAVAHYVIGLAGQLSARSDTGTDEDQDIRNFYHALDPTRYGATVTSASYLPSSLDHEFQFGLHLIIDGLAMRLSHPVHRPLEK